MNETAFPAFWLPFVSEILSIDRQIVIFGSYNQRLNMTRMDLFGKDMIQKNAQDA